MFHNWGLYPLQQSLMIGSYVKMLVPMVLSDRYRITQEKSNLLGVVEFLRQLGRCTNALLPVRVVQRGVAGSRFFDWTLIPY